MRILLTGADGQLGRHLAPRLATLGEVIATDVSGGDKRGYFPCDLGDRRLLDKSLNRVKPDLIVNPAAWTAVDRAEDEPEMARKLNRDLPGWLGEWCAANDAFVLHFSTDYIFSGQNERPWAETDEPAPESVYGRTKLAGEQALQASGARALIVRTAWLYSHFPGNFLSAILTRAERGEALKVVSDQIGSPTWAGHLADACVALLKQRDALTRPLATCHFSGNGRMSWYEFARLGVDYARQAGVLEENVEIEPIASARWPQKARRPAWSVLDCEHYRHLTGLDVPTIEDGLSACLKQWADSAC